MNCVFLGKQVIVLLDPNHQDKEMITRARNKVVIVTPRYRMHTPDHMAELLEEAVDHGDEGFAACRSLGDRCEFAGRRLLQKVVLGSQVGASKGHTPFSVPPSPSPQPILMPR